MPPHCPDAVHTTMQALAEGLHKILGDRLIGVYLGGSVAMGDFSERSSDLDFLAVTRGPLSQEDALAVDLLHRELRERHTYAARLEGDYAPVELLVPEGTTAPVPGCERGVFLPKVGEIMLSADNILNMRDHGIAFFGPEPNAVLPPVSGDQVRSAVREMLVNGHGACETPEETAAAVLNLVRSACALEMGAPATKAQGAAWALAHLDRRWSPVIEAALAVRADRGTPADECILNEMLPALDRFVRTQFC